MSKEYDLYLTEHIGNVQKGWDWMRTNLLPEIDEWIARTYRDTTPVIDIYGINALMDKHDQSKYEREEYIPYDDYFYGPSATRGSHATVEAFNTAFLRHIHKNPHHWQYWVLVHDDPDEKFEAIEMPLNYIFEMICDWWTFSWKANDLNEVFQWYEDHKAHMILHNRTKKTVEYILTAMKKLLAEQIFIDEKDLDVVSHAYPWGKHKKTAEAKSDDEDRKYGVAEQKKFPLPDADHVHSAIKFFNYVEPKYEEELAKAILKRAKEYGVDISKINVGDENRFKKYLPKKES